MKVLQIMGLVFFSLLAVGGLMTANGVTGNLVAGCDCISDACIKACGPNASEQCCLTQDGESKLIPEFSSTGGYVVSFVGLAGFFAILAQNKKEEDFY